MEKTEREQNQNFRYLAKLIAVNCILSSSFSSLNCNRKIREKKMKSIMDMTNKIYTFLKYSNNRDFIILMDMNYPENWSNPKLDKDLLEIMVRGGLIKSPPVTRGVSGIKNSKTV